MAHIKFIDTVVRNLPASAKGQTIYWAVGLSGLGVRVGVSGRKSFISKISFQSKDRIVTHGKYPEIGIKEAIERHHALLDRAARGLSLEAEEKVHGENIELLGRAYFERRQIAGFKDVGNQRGIFEKNVVPFLGKKDPSEIRPKHIRECLHRTLERIKADRPDIEGAGLSHIRHLQVVLRGFFKWLVSEEIIDMNPALSVETVGVARVRERVLTPVEIWRFWRAIDLTGLDNHVVNALRFMLATGQRAKEVRSLRWADLDLREKVWQISAGTAKNKRMHRVPLNDLAFKIIHDSRPSSYVRLQSDVYVFGATKSLSERTLSKALLRKRKEIGIEDFTPHDLRRTAATMITAVGLPSLYASLLLNHAQQGITNRVYVHYSYDFEKKKAADIWGEALFYIVSAVRVGDVPDVGKIKNRLVSLGLLREGGGL